MRNISKWLVAATIVVSGQQSANAGFVRVAACARLDDEADFA